MEDKNLQEFKFVAHQMIASNNRVIASNLVAPFIDLCRKGKSPEKAWEEILRVYQEILIFIDRE